MLLTSCKFRTLMGGGGSVIYPRFLCYPSRTCSCHHWFCWMWHPSSPLSTGATQRARVLSRDRLLRELCVCHLWRYRPVYTPLPSVTVSDRETDSPAAPRSGSPRRGAGTERNGKEAPRSPTRVPHWHGHRRRALTTQEPCLPSSVAKGNFPLSAFCSDAHTLRWDDGWSEE